MDLAYVCEWEKRPKSDHCPSIPLVCAWSCRNLIAFTTDLRNEEERGGGRALLLQGEGACIQIAQPGLQAARIAAVQITDPAGATQGSSPPILRCWDQAGHSGTPRTRGVQRPHPRGRHCSPHLQMPHVRSTRSQHPKHGPKTQNPVGVPWTPCCRAGQPFPRRATHKVTRPAANPLLETRRCLTWHHPTARGAGAEPAARQESPPLI
uniref:Uncharacterized protein n=1 Tax=Meleagris gallopavo TaxID=9103 RepID=A0A803YA24_MELGA